MGLSVHQPDVSCTLMIQKREKYLKIEIERHFSVAETMRIALRKTSALRLTISSISRCLPEIIDHYKGEISRSIFPPKYEAENIENGVGIGEDKMFACLGLFDGAFLLLSFCICVIPAWVECENLK